MDCHNTTDTSTVAKIKTLLGGVSNDVGSLLAAGCIKNPTLTTEVEVAVKTLTGEVSAILSQLPA